MITPSSLTTNIYTQMTSARWRPSKHHPWEEQTCPWVQKTQGHCIIDGSPFCFRFGQFNETSQYFEFDCQKSMGSQTETPWKQGISEGF